MKVLIFTPTLGLDPEAVQSAFTQDWPGPVDILYTHDNPHGESKADVLYNYNRGREWALTGGYDAMLTLESDMVAPPDTLVKLMRTGAPVSHALYCFRGRGHAWNLLDVGGQYADKAGCQNAWGRVLPARGLGFGCTLIRRDALEAVPFRIENECHPDWYFAEDCAAKGIGVVVHCGAAVGHKERDGHIWWPAADGGAWATVSSEQELYAYIGQGDYLPGLPTRDLSPEEWAQQPEELREWAESLGVFRRIIPKPTDWALDRRFVPCQK
jgi:hypothetical protein